MDLSCLPIEIVRKICLFIPTINKNLLKEIRCSYIIRKIEKMYYNYWVILFSSDRNNMYDWLENDIMFWMNEEKGTLIKITDKLKHFLNKTFKVKINNYQDLEIWDIQFRKLYPSTKLGWNVYSSNCSEKDINEFYIWTKNIIH